MMLEQGHGFSHRLAPLTVCQYEVDAQDIVDLRTAELQRAAGIGLADLSCAWRLELAEGREPASWTVAKRLIIEGAAGILTPSFAHAADPARHHNLMLWRWGPDLPYRVVVVDPDERLPRNQESWPHRRR
jgi:RES domain-containing protein